MDTDIQVTIDTETPLGLTLDAPDASPISQPYVTGTCESDATITVSFSPTGEEQNDVLCTR